jgi:hypothetical protein
MLRQAHPALMKLAVCELPTSASQDRNVRVSTIGAGRAALLMIEAAYRAARTGVRQPVEPDPDHGTS